MGRQEEGGGGGWSEVAPAVRTFLRGETVPGIARQGLGVIGGMDDGEAVAEEAIPFGGCGGGGGGGGGRWGFGVEDLEVEG